MPEKKVQEKGFNSLYRRYLYYFIIGIVSFVSLVFLPMLGTTVSLGFNLPQTQAAWTVFITTRLCVSLINVLIFHAFMEQGKLNVQDNEDYIHANEILKNVKEARVKQAMSPHKWLAKQYSSKGVTLFISSMLATFAISQAVLQYDWITLISYAFTIGSAIIFGILQMKKAEIYWSIEYPQYAGDYEDKLIKRQAELEQRKLNQQKVAEEQAKEAEERAKREAIEAEERKKREEEEAAHKAEEEAIAKAKAEEEAKKKAEFEAALAQLKEKIYGGEIVND